MIGVTAYAQPAKWGVWDLPAVLAPLAYVEAIERAGGRAVLVPPSEHGVDEVLDGLDGVIFSGGADVNPEHYGQEPHPETDEPQHHRDLGELALMHAAMERDLPMLAICRGFQLLNVARGGSLIQHLPEALGHDDHKQVPGVFSEHPVEVREGTRLAGLLGTRPDVPSHHHQAVGQLGEGLVDSAWAADGTLEAVEDPNKPFVVGVQWHPEAGEDQALFDALVSEARAHRAVRLLESS